MNIWAFDESARSGGSANMIGKVEQLQSLSDSNYNSHLIADIKEELPVLGNPWTDTSKESLSSSSASEKTSSEPFGSDLLGGAFCGEPELS